MKKQILVLIVALFASITMVYGQATHGSDPIPLNLLNCEIGPLTPIAGVPFDYSANVDPALGSAYWYATTATTFIQNGVRVPGIEEPNPGPVVAAATNYMDNGMGDTSPTTTTITWTTAGLALVDDTHPLFVAIEYTAAPTDCSNNMKVYRILPKNAFTVDIMNWDPGNTLPSGYGILEEQCYDVIQSAVFVGGVMDYDFGTNIMYFEVVAANFTHNFTPSFQLTGLHANQTATLEYGVVNGTYTVNLGTFPAGAMIPIPGQVVTTTVTNTSNGVSIYLRLTIANQDYEGLTDDAISMAVDAVNSANQPDVDNDDCDVVTPYSDVATQNLNRRPTVTPVAPATFVPQVTP